MKLMFNLLVSFVLILLFVVSCRSNVNQADEGKHHNLNSVLDKTTELSLIDDENYMLALNNLSEHSSGDKLIFNESGRGVAYISKKGDLVQLVHNGKGGKFYKAINHILISDDGQRVAYSVEIQNGKECLVVDGIEGLTFDSVGQPRFSRNNKHVLYDARVGEEWYLVVDNHKSEGHLLFYDKSFSSDSKYVYAIQNPPDEKSPRKFVVRDLKLNIVSENDLFTKHTVYSKDMTRVAMVASENDKQQIVVFDFANPKSIKYGHFYREIGLESFGSDDKSVSYIAEKDSNVYVVLDDKEERLPAVEIKQPPVIRPDNKEVGLVLKNKDQAYVYRAFSGGKLNNRHYDEVAHIVYSADSQHNAYVARSDKRVFAVVDGFETPAFDMVLRPIFSPDNKMLVFRARKDGKRFVVVADTKGKLVHQFNAYDMVFQPVFTADGKSIGYGVKDGNKLVWRVEKL